jgi:hypothetical protein
MSLTERELKVVDYMANLIVVSLDRMDNLAKEMIKYNTGILAVLTGLATYFEVKIQYLAIPLIFIFIGIIFFIAVIQISPIEYIVGDVESSIKAYEKLSKKKYIRSKIGFITTYLGFFTFIIIILA